MISSRIIRIDRFFNYVSNRLDFSCIDPINAKIEEKHFRDTRKNPMFRYKKFDQKLKSLNGILPEIRLNNHDLDRIMKEKRNELIRKLDMFEAVGKPTFTTISSKIYPPPSRELVKQAKKILKLKPSKKPAKILKKEAVAMLRSAFKMQGIRWKIINKTMVSNARVQPSKHILYLKKREKFSRDYVKRLILHEIGTHALRTENGKMQMLRIFKYGFANHLETEEGLAAYNEYKGGLMTHSILRTYAGRVLAVHYALKYSFLKTYDHLCKYFKPKTSWKLTLRAKRGVKDTSKPGAYTKDVVYLRGFLRVLEFAKKRDVNQLYVGKIKIEDLRYIPSIPGVIQALHSTKVFFKNPEFLRSERGITEEEWKKIL